MKEKRQGRGCGEVEPWAVRDLGTDRGVAESAPLNVFRLLGSLSKGCFLYPMVEGGRDSLKWERIPGRKRTYLVVLQNKDSTVAQTLGKDDAGRSGDMCE